MHIPSLSALTGLGRRSHASAHASSNVNSNVNTNANSNVNTSNANANANSNSNTNSNSTPNTHSNPNPNITSNSNSTVNADVNNSSGVTSRSSSTANANNGGVNVSSRSSSNTGYTTNTTQPQSRPQSRPESRPPSRPQSRPQSRPVSRPQSRTSTRSLSTAGFFAFGAHIPGLSGMSASSTQSSSNSTASGLDVMMEDGGCEDGLGDRLGGDGVGVGRVCEDDCRSGDKLNDHIYKHETTTTSLSTSSGGSAAAARFHTSPPSHFYTDTSSVDNSNTHTPPIISPSPNTNINTVSDYNTDKYHNTNNNTGINTNSDFNSDYNTNSDFNNSDFTTYTNSDINADKYYNTAPFYNSNPATGSRNPANNSFNPAVNSFNPAVNSRNPAFTSSRPALTSSRPPVTSRPPTISSRPPTISCSPPSPTLFGMDEYTRDLGMDARGSEDARGFGIGVQDTGFGKSENKREFGIGMGVVDKESEVGCGGGLGSVEANAEGEEARGLAREEEARGGEKARARAQDEKKTRAQVEEKTRAQVEEKARAQDAADQAADQAADEEEEHESQQSQILAAGAAARDKRGGGSRVGTPVGVRGVCGLSGSGGLSGLSGLSGASGLSGLSGASGLTGRTGTSGPTTTTAAAAVGPATSISLQNLKDATPISSQKNNVIPASRSVKGLSMSFAAVVSAKMPVVGGAGGAVSKVPLKATLTPSGAITAPMQTPMGAITAFSAEVVMPAISTSTAMSSITSSSAISMIPATSTTSITSTSITSTSSTSMPTTTPTSRIATTTSNPPTSIPPSTSTTASPPTTPAMIANTRRTRRRMSVLGASTSGAGVGVGVVMVGEAVIGEGGEEEGKIESERESEDKNEDEEQDEDQDWDEDEDEDEVEDKDEDGEGGGERVYGDHERLYGDHERGDTGVSLMSAASGKSAMSDAVSMSSAGCCLSDVEAYLDMVGIDRTITSDSPIGGLSASVSAPALYSTWALASPASASVIGSSASLSTITSSTLALSTSTSTLTSSTSASTLTSSSSLGSICSVDTIIDESPVIPVIMQFGEERGVRGLDGSLHAPSGGKGLGLGVVGEGEKGGQGKAVTREGAMLGGTPQRVGDGGSSVHSLSPLPISFGDNAQAGVNANANTAASTGVVVGSTRSGPPSVIGSERGSPPSSRHSPSSGMYEAPAKPVTATVPLPDVAEERERQMQDAMERMGISASQERGVYASVYAQQQQQLQQQQQHQQQEFEHQQQQQRRDFEHQYQQQQREFEIQQQQGLGSQLNLHNLAPTHLDIYGSSNSSAGGGFGHGISPQRSPSHIHAQIGSGAYGGGGMGMGLQASSSDLSSMGGSAHLSSMHDNGLRTAPLPGTAAAMDAAAAAASGKTPNVYINGLPPHFPEDQLYALAAPYGDIRSVRTFTRHVRDCESGYGFVLFETIDAAERCIIALRKYRNLHPTFSKQIHKIPGTTYAQGVASSSNVGGAGGIDLSGGAHAMGGDASFKAKMETLADPTSTNLYMEGLPLSIDEPTLGALVAPHRIVSSRFFQTRLSSPPRIIAFVRLDTRHGAEEIIEKLHGRMVRGWNDTGSRISVRFADTTEQRELRRMERSAQEGDGAPTRLTIAQAALLNLRGQDLQPPKGGPVIHTSGIGMGRLAQGSMRGGSLATSASVPDFSSNLYHQQGLTGGLEVDYSLAPGRSAAAVLNSRSHSPYDYDHGVSQQQLMYAMGLTPPPPTAMPLGIDPTMAALIDSSQHTLGTANAFGSYGLRRTGAGLSTSQSLDNLQGYVGAHSGPAYTRTGYTPTEEYIMRAHAESAVLLAHQQQLQMQQAQAQLQHGERRRPAPLNLSRQRSAEEMMGMAGGGVEEHDIVPANIAVGVRAYRTQASLSRVASGVGSVTSPLSPMEDEVHSHSSMQQQQSQRPLVFSPLVAQDQQQQQSNVNDLLAYHQQSAAAHMRSTTLPQHRSTSGSSAPRHVQHNSMSMPPQNLRTPQHASVAAFANAGAASSGTIYESEGQEDGGRGGKGDEVGRGSRASMTTSKSQLSNSSGMFGDAMDQNSPSMISPTLTYSSQTPSTLSPATPFFGSFGNQEGFEKGVGVGFIGEQQQKKSPNPHGAVGSALGPSGLRS